jgi:DNA invertase Pin-like site-specific DNA recombinase
MEHARSRTRRCAVYTRKSSEEGLEQDFNSLHAQREACEAFIKSQTGEGWRLIRTAYDDGGLSEGTMERPALQHLLEDIRRTLVDVVVVYKVDHLTRSLADFAKMVEVFDARGVSFVAVTQQFNTTTSMGRLTLNVLLSFGQFEREVTGERIRYKIAASKPQGNVDGRSTATGPRRPRSPAGTQSARSRDSETHLRAISRTRFRQAPEKRFRMPRDCLQSPGVKKLCSLLSREGFKLNAKSHAWRTGFGTRRASFSAMSILLSGSPATPPLSCNVSFESWAPRNSAWELSRVANGPNSPKMLTARSPA